MKAKETSSMNKAALYARVSTPEQHVESQLYDLRAFAQQRGLDVVCEYTDIGSGKKARRPVVAGRVAAFDFLLDLAPDAGAALLDGFEPDAACFLGLRRSAAPF